MKFISILTDFGIDQEYPAVCKAVILSICPSAVIVDISHTVPSYDIEEGAFMLKNFIKYAPVGVHVAVIDPGVGTQRRGIAIATRRGDFLVGPDNGVLMEAAHFLGIEKVAVLEDKEYMLEKVYSSFHGRDIFAPAAAHLLKGVPITALGRMLDIKELVHVPRLPPSEDETAIYGTVLRIDRFGNIQTTIDAEIVPKKPALTMRIGEKELTLPFVKTFGEVGPGACLVYEDSDGLITLSQNQGDASRLLGAEKRMEVLIFK
ncbi:MAG: SAM-dependent chlorinase/fluorinase [Theionarchaea archaeon]|nr:SAM-dependent chlorinase/fluorinase [Theionarchaea archaeon]